MSAHNVLQELSQANYEVVDIGDGETYSFQQSPVYVPIVTAAAETRTLPAPTKAGLQVWFSMKEDGGNCTITVTGGYDEVGNTELLIANVGETVGLVSVMGTATAYRWRVMFNDAVAPFTINGTEVTATADEINMAADSSANVETVTATNVITAAESGKTFFLASATEFDSALPAPAAGLRYRFIVAAAPSGASYTVTTNASAQILAGQVHSSTGGDADSEAAATATTLTFVDGAAVVGDWAEFISDGTSWFCQAFCNADTGITFTG